MFKVIIIVCLSLILILSCKKNNEVKPEDIFVFGPNDYSWDGSWSPASFLKVKLLIQSALRFSTLGE